DVRVGVSLDGPAAAHDQRRRTVAGGETHAAVTRALHLLAGPAYRRLYARLLCVVDLDGDPVAVYEELLGHAPPAGHFPLRPRTAGGQLPASPRQLDDAAPRPGSDPGQSAVWRLAGRCL